MDVMIQTSDGRSRSLAPSQALEAIRTMIGAAGALGAGIVIRISLADATDRSRPRRRRARRAPRAPRKASPVGRRTQVRATIRRAMTKDDFSASQLAERLGITRAGVDYHVRRIREEEEAKTAKS